MPKRKESKVIPPFKVRAASNVQIMGVKGLGITGKTYLKLWLKSQMFNRKPTIKSKFLEKGNIVEDNSIDFAADMLGLGMLIKNEKKYENSWAIGIPDVVTEDCVYEQKNSWSWETYPFLDDEPDKGHARQTLIYMALAKKNKGKLIYTLMDTPLNLIEREARFYCLNNGYDGLDMDIFRDFKKKMTYSDIPDKDRIKVFDIERDEGEIAIINQRVIECREYIKTLTA